jgi:hypothetical protein
MVPALSGGETMRRWIFVPPAVFLMTAFLSGCISQEALQNKLRLIEDKHGIVVCADNGLSRCLLFGNVNKLLDQIDRDLEACPEYFKCHIGNVIIEETFADNPEVCGINLILRAYVDSEDWTEGYAIHIKNRSIGEKILLYGHNEKQIFLHEAMHSFELNMCASHPDEWERFYNEFHMFRPENYQPILPAAVTLSGLPLDMLGLRPKSMASFYGASNHREDVAETWCFLQKHSGQIEFLKAKDPALYGKCLAVEKFVCGGYSNIVAQKNDVVTKAE